MRPSPDILFDPDCPTARAAVRVLSVLGFRSRPASAWREAPDFPILLVHDRTGDRLPLIAPLRRDGFRGAIVVLTGTTDDIAILARNPVLCFGWESASTVWSPGRPIGRLARTVATLSPIGDDILRQVQTELLIPANFLKATVQPYLARLRADGVTAETVQGFRELIRRAALWSARACHAEATIGSHTVTLSAHFRRLLGELEAAAPDICRVADELDEAFSVWMAIVTTDAF